MAPSDVLLSRRHKIIHVTPTFQNSLQNSLLRLPSIIHYILLNLIHDLKSLPF